MATLPVENVSVSINRSTRDVYEYVSNPENLPTWASGLSDSIKLIRDKWIAESPMGKIEIRFIERNHFGVLDHHVTLESGETFYNPMRVIANQDGCEVIFTLFHWPTATDEEFLKDIKWIENDLANLKKNLES